MHELFFSNDYNLFLVYDNFVIYKMNKETKYKLAVWTGPHDEDYKNLGEFNSLAEAKAIVLLESI